jgi:D-alanyl-D-alanine carboxypeptidase (penicillin-binding protein 5/6)
MTLAKVSKIWFSLLFLFGLYTAASFYWQQSNHFSFNYQPRPILRTRDQDLPQDLSAQAYLIMDAQTGTIVKSKNKDWRLPPASLTKIPAAIVAIKKYPLNQTVTVKEEYPVGKIMNLKENEQIDVNSLLHGLLIHSANDAAYVLAGQDDQQRQEFINEMNQLAQQYDLDKTHFVNFDGEQDISHLSSAFDLAQLTRLGLKNPIFKQLVQMPEKIIYDQSGRVAHKLENTNELLAEFDNVKGVKTGWTPQAGECLISLVYIDNNPVLTVVLDSQDRFEDTRKLINWSQNNLSWNQP